MIDRANDQPWPEEVRETMARYKQGDLLERPPFFYAARPDHGVWQLTRASDPEGPDTDLFELDPDSPDAPPYGVITSQTCDIDEQARKPKQPWIQIAPVFDMTDILDRGQKGQVQRYEIVHLAKLSPPSLPDAFWVADLRIQFPLEKSCLVDRHPIAGFGSEIEAERFADHLARRVGRPALANVLSNVIVQSLRKEFKKIGAADRITILPRDLELRLEIDPTRLRAKAARLMVITDPEPPSLEIRGWFERWWVATEAEARAQGLLLLKNWYTTYDEPTARQYKRAVELDFRYLSPEES